MTKKANKPNGINKLIKILEKQQENNKLYKESLRNKYLNQISQQNKFISINEYEQYLLDLLYYGKI